MPGQQSGPDANARAAADPPPHADDVDDLPSRVAAGADGGRDRAVRLLAGLRRPHPDDARPGCPAGCGDEHEHWRPAFLVDYAGSAQWVATERGVALRPLAAAG